LGVYVSYADIHNAAALVEVSGEEIGTAPEASLGTHFFQDLMEAQIYPLALSLNDKNVRFNREFFYNSPNSIERFLTIDADMAECINLIEVNAACPGHHLELIMDDEKGEAVAFLAV
jgi:pyruvate,water dikinase